MIAPMDKIESPAVTILLKEAERAPAGSTDQHQDNPATSAARRTVGGRTVSYAPRARGPCSDWISCGVWRLAVQYVEVTYVGIDDDNRTDRHSDDWEREHGPQPVDGDAAMRRRHDRHTVPTR